MSTPLPRLVARLVKSVVPTRGSDELVADLADDYDRIRARRHPVRAAWWLTRETGSLVVAYVMKPLVGLTDLAPMVMRDVRMVLRALGRGGLWPAAGAAAMLSIGLLAVMLTAGLAQALLFRQVSTAHGESLRRITAINRQGQSALRLSFPELQTIAAHVKDVAELTAINMQPVVVRAAGADIQTMAEVVDGNYFRLTGTTTIVGRPIVRADDQLGATPVVVLSMPFWQRHFDASPQVLGQTINVNGQPFIVAGVSRALGSSSFLGASVDAWLPMAHADALLNRGWRTNVGDRWFGSFVLPRTSSAELDARLATAASDLARLHPVVWRERRLQTSPATVLAGSQRASVTMLVGILGGLGLLILFAAASNLGGVLLARAAVTRRHVAIHLSLGSSRTAMIRRQLFEGALLGLMGAAIAVGVYAWARLRLTEIALLPTLALRLDLPLDTVVVTITATAGIVAGIVLAIGPGLWATRVGIADALRDAAHRSSSGRGVVRIRRALVAAQVCLSLILIVGAALFTRSLTALADADLGFPRQGLVAMDFDLEPSTPAMSELPALAREALARAESTPGVLAAAMSNRAPIDQSTPGIAVRVGSEQGKGVDDVSVYLATARYFETLQLPLVAGRNFTPIESDSSADVVIVNESLARRLWPDGDALDRTLYIAGEARTVRVVGVARNSKYRSITETERSHLYRPTPPRLGLTLLARTAGDPRQTLGALQQTLNSVGPGVIGFFPRTLADHLAIDLLPTRAAASAAALLGTLALALSMIGLFGLVAWFVELRRREIGVRIALGASARAVRALVLREALSTALPGIVIGLVLSAGLGLLARAALFGVEPLDPAALAAGVVALGMVVGIASYLPSRRATRIDPVVVLRE